MAEASAAATKKKTRRKAAPKAERRPGRRSAKGNAPPPDQDDAAPLPAAEPAPAAPAAPPAAELDAAPAGFQDRHYQADARRALADGIRRLLLAWHRRAGKDRFGLDVIRERAQTEVGAYWHLYPYQAQAKRAIWYGVDPGTGRRFLDDVFPPETRRNVDNRDLMIELRNGSTYQLLGSDYYDRLVGSNVRGVLLSEWALCDPAAWPYIMPILVENGGWAAFISTYRGKNHMWQMVQRLRANPEWYVDERTILDTRRNDGTPVVSADDVAREREALMALYRNAARVDALIQEEFYMSPIQAAQGSIYGRYVAAMIQEGRAAA